MIKSFFISLMIFCLLPYAGRAQVVEKGFEQDKGLQSQTFELRKENDSLYWIATTSGDNVNDWRLPYPVYRFQTGDVNGDGSENAIVGVIKKTRFYPMGKRLFIFKQIDGHTALGKACKKVRPLWMGSKLGGILEDFRFIAPADGKSRGMIRALESTTDSLYVVSDYKWSGFGMKFDRFLIKGVDKETATKYLNQ